MKSIKTIYNSAANAVEKNFPESSPVIKEGITFLAMSATTATCLRFFVKECVKSIVFSMLASMKDPDTMLLIPPETGASKAMGIKNAGRSTDATLMAYTLRNSMHRM